MLTFFPPGIQPDKDALENGQIGNRDGHGYAIVVPGYEPRIIVNHGLNAEKILEIFMEDRFKYPDGPALFHSRFGTSGSTDEYNCHPFFMDDERMTVVAHNGILPPDIQPHKEDRRCDTRWAAEEYFGQSHGHLSYSGARALLAQDIGKGNKLVILTIDPKFPFNYYIINEDQGVWDESIWYSNYGYCTPIISIYNGDWKPFHFYGTATGEDTDYDTEFLDDTDCPVCNSKDAINPISLVCEMCGTCMECFKDLGECLCYPGTEYYKEELHTAQKQLTAGTQNAGAGTWGWKDYE